MNNPTSKYKEETFTDLLEKVMQPETYKGIRIKNVLGRFQIGIKSFKTIELAKEFIDTF